MHYSTAYLLGAGAAAGSPLQRPTLSPHQTKAIPIRGIHRSRNEPILARSVPPPNHGFPESDACDSDDHDAADDGDFVYVDSDDDEDEVCKMFAFDLDGSGAHPLERRHRRRSASSSSSPTRENASRRLQLSPTSSSVRRVLRFPSSHTSDGASYPPQMLPAGEVVAGDVVLDGRTPTEISADTEPVHEAPAFACLMDPRPIQFPYDGPPRSPPTDAQVLHTSRAAEKPMEASFDSLPEALVSKIVMLTGTRAVAAYMTVCTHFYRALIREATSVVIRRPPPRSVRLTASLLRDCMLRSLDMLHCQGTWPLTHIVPLLPHIETIRARPEVWRSAAISSLPPTVKVVDLGRVTIQNEAQAAYLVRLQILLQTRGTDLQHTLIAPGHSPPAERSRERKLPVGGLSLASGRGPPAGAAKLPKCTKALLPMAANQTLKERTINQRQVLAVGGLRPPAAEPLLVNGLPAGHLSTAFGRASAASPSQASELPKLTGELVLEMKMADEIPQTLWQLTAMTGLDLTHLGDIPTELHALQDLVLLRVQAACDAGVQSTLGPLTAVKRLEISSHMCLLGDPSITSRLPALREVRLSNLLAPQLMAQRHWPSGWPGFTRLEIDNCVAEALPEELGLLTGLQELEVTNCSLKRLPESLCTLSLRSLTVSNCRYLSSLPHLSSLTTLERLDLSACYDLAHAATSLSGLTRLSHLSIAGCRFAASLLNKIDTLPALRSLDLSHCTSLKGLPPALGRLPQLRSLSLAGCSNLRSVSLALSGLTSLQLLDLRRTRLTEILLHEVFGLRPMLPGLVLNDREYPGHQLDAGFNAMQLFFDVQH